MDACKKEEKKEILKCSHDSMEINPSTFLQHKRLHGGIVFKVSGAAAAPTLQRPKQH